MSALPRAFVLGANYWSRAGGPRMWERFDEATIERELAKLSAIGLDALRVFAFIPTFMPRPPVVEEAALARLSRFADLAATRGLSLLPTPLVGHMSGENFDFAGQRGRSLYRDAELLGWQVALVSAVARTLATKNNIVAHVLTNEMPLWGGRGEEADVRAWAEALTAAVRAIDPARPVGVGDGMMADWPSRALTPLTDFIAPHLYYGDVDPLRQAFSIDFAIARARAICPEVLLEEFGGSATQAGEAEHAAYVRESCLTAFASGCKGALVWCASDFDEETLGHEAPYSHHAFELGFGLLRADGSEKPACDEMRALRRFLDGIDVAALSRPRARVALVKSDWTERSFPFSWEDKTGLARALLQAYVLAAQAGLDVDVVAEDDDLAPYALLLVPSTQKLRVPTWHKLEAAARAGATVYWSYFSGENDFHQGAWCPNFEALTGLRHRLRYGCFNLPGERLTWKGQVPLSVPTGQSHSSSPASLALLPIEPASSPGGADVQTLCVDGNGRLALALHRLGKGRVVFSAYPLERYLMALADGSQREAHRLYRLLADEAGLSIRYETHHPDVQARVLSLGADELVVVQHRGFTPSVDDAVELPGEAELVYDRGNPSPDAFGKKGARIWRVRQVG